MDVITPRNCDVSVKKAVQQLKTAIKFDKIRTFPSITLTDLTASSLVGTNASKLLESVTIGSSLTYTRPTLDTIQDIQTTASPAWVGLTLSKVCTAAAGLNVLRVTGLQTDDTALTGTLRGGYIDVSNGALDATGTIRALELKARAEAPGDAGNDVAVLEGLSISADSKGHSVTTMRAAEFILDGKTGGTITEAVGLRIANNLQADKADTSYGLQIYRDSFDYTADIQLSSGGLIGGSDGALRIASSGTVTIQPVTDSIDALHVLDANTDVSVFQVDTVNHRVGVLTSGAPATRFHVAADFGTMPPDISSVVVAITNNSDAGDDVRIALIGGTNSGSCSFWFGDEDTARAGYISYINRTNATIEYMQFGVNVADKMRLWANGSLNIGATGLPKVKLQVEGTFGLKELAAAVDDVAGIAQIYAKNDAPNTLWFVNDVGTEVRIAPQDLQVTASPTFVGGTFSAVVTGVLPTASAHLATKEYVDLAVGARDTFFLSDTGSGVGDLNFAYQHETTDVESTAVNDGVDEEYGEGTHLHQGFITEAGQPGTTILTSGVLSFDFHAKKGNANQRATTLYAILSSVDADGTTGKTTIAQSATTADLTDAEVIYHIHASLAEEVEIADTARLILDIYAVVGAGAQDTVVTLYMEGNHDSHFQIGIAGGVWQNWGPVLDDLNTLGANSADSEFLVGTAAGALTWESGATVRTSLGLGTGDAPEFEDLDINDLILTGRIWIESQGAIQLYDSGSANYVGFRAPATVGGGNDVLYTMPVDGNNGEALITDGSGTLSWSTVASTFVSLSDTPAAYNTDQGRVCIVNSTPDGVEFSSTLIVPSAGIAYINDVLMPFERAAAVADVEGRGQIWVKDTTPNQLWFTNDIGTDVQLGVPSAGFISRCRVTLGTQQTITTGTITKVNLDTEQYDDSNEWANNKYTVVDDGKYLIVYNVSISLLNDEDSGYGLIYKNGAVIGCVCRTFSSKDAGTSYSPGADILELVTNDFIEIHALHDFGADRVMPVPGDLQINFVAIHRLS